MPVLTIDHNVCVKGESTPTSIIVETSNRYEVVQKLTKNKFSSNDNCSFFSCLDDMVKSGLIKSYNTGIMRLSSDEIWLD